MYDDDGGVPALDAAAEFRRHHEPLVRYLARLTGDPEMAADAAQESFVRLIQQRPPPHDPRPWLFTVATNLVRETARKRTRHRVLAFDGRAEGAHGDRPRPPDGGADRERARRMVRAALDGLSPKERQALLMREEGFKHREIAAALDTTTGSIGTLIRRAIGKAADRLSMEEDGS